MLYRVFFYWLYEKNKSFYSFTHVKYTPYFDCEGNRIAENDWVIFYRRLYKIYC